MTYAIPVLDLENAQLEAVRAGTGELGAVQVVNHGVPAGLSEDLGRRMARLLGLPRAEKERLASPHPYRGHALRGRAGRELGRPVKHLIAKGRNSIGRLHTAIAITVVPESRPVTCGLVVYKMVDNRS